MGRREIIDSRDAWWVWVGGNDAVRVKTEEAAAKLLCEHGGEFTGEQESHCDLANAVREVLWNEPLPEGESFHKTVFDPLMMIVHKGKARKILPRMTASRLKRMPPDWADLYRAADSDGEVLSIKPKIPLIEQLEGRRPSLKADPR